MHINGIQITVNGINGMMITHQTLAGMMYGVMFVGWHSTISMRRSSQWFCSQTAYAIFTPEHFRSYRTRYGQNIQARIPFSEQM